MNKRLALSLFCIYLWTNCTTAVADPGYYLVTVYDNKGELAIDYRYWTVKFPGRSETIWPELGIAYGVTARWNTEFYASTVGKSRDDLMLSSWNWQNDFLLTQGQYPVDVALHTNLVRYHDIEDGYTLEIGPALQTEIGRLQLNGNVFFQRDYRSEYGGATQMRYQWQTKYRWRPALQFGLQGFGELGDWNHWAPREHQSHRAGPVLSGSVPVTANSTLKYQAAYLMGSIYGRHGDMFSMRIQYAF